MQRSTTERLVGGLLLASFIAVWPLWGWGQEVEPVGTVLAVDGIAEVQAQGGTTWEPLRFRDEILVHDTVRTGDHSKLKVLLRDDSIITLAERSELAFTEFLLTPQQRRNIMHLFIGTLKVLTTRIFGYESVIEVHTPNAVAGVRGTVFIVSFFDNITRIFSEAGTVTVWNVDHILEEVAESFHTIIRGFDPPTPPMPTTPHQEQQLQERLALRVRVPDTLIPTLAGPIQQGIEVPRPPVPPSPPPAPDGMIHPNPHTENTITPDTVLRDLHRAPDVIIPIPEPR